MESIPESVPVPDMSVFELFGSPLPLLDHSTWRGSKTEVIREIIEEEYEKVQENGERIEVIVKESIKESLKKYKRKY